jgi:hypothetical protein
MVNESLSFAPEMIHCGPIASCRDARSLRGNPAGGADRSVHRAFVSAPRADLSRRAADNFVRSGSLIDARSTSFGEQALPTDRGTLQ